MLLDRFTVTENLIIMLPETTFIQHYNPGLIYRQHCQWNVNTANDSFFFYQMVVWILRAFYWQENSQLDNSDCFSVSQSSINYSKILSCHTFFINLLHCSVISAKFANAIGWHDAIYSPWMNYAKVYGNSMSASETILGGAFCCMKMHSIGSNG